MNTIFSDMTPMEVFFAICAIGGGFLFVVRLILQFMGAVGDVHDITDLTGGPDAHLGDSDVSFKLLSLQGLTAFFMMFGLVGLALSQMGGVPDGISLIGALLAGAGSFFIIQKMFAVMGRLQSSGNVNLQNAVGQEGTVYMNIVPPERGKVEVTVQNRLRVLDAVTENGEPLKTGERVRIVKVYDTSVLVVERVTAPVSEAV